MVIGTVKSKNGISIRLTEERWRHITSSHPEITSNSHQLVLETVENPEVIFKGDVGELLAVQKIPRKKAYLVVPYKELREDGFILTAYLTTDSEWLFKREIIWNKE